jgi:hypothetical protein
VESNWVHSALQPLLGLLCQPRGDYDVGEIGGIIIGMGNRSTLRKPAPVPLCPPQTPHAVRARTRSTAVGSQRLTAWATVRPGWSYDKTLHAYNTRVITKKTKILQTDCLNSCAVCIITRWSIVSDDGINSRSQISSVGRAKGYGVDSPGSIPGKVRFFSSP